MIPYDVIAVRTRRHPRQGGRCLGWHQLKFSARILQELEAATKACCSARP